jgi:hypothetical protein
MDLAVVAAEDRDRRARHRVPNPRRLVVRSRDDTRAVRRKGGAFDRVVMPAEDRETWSARDEGCQRATPMPGQAARRLNFVENTASGIVPRRKPVSIALTGVLDRAFRSARYA